ncbi:MAG: flavodoxin [Candidatus Omnitrophota bacterium]|jgi:flavodoxin
MRAIIIYYSYSGNTKKIADCLANYLQGENEVKVLRLETQDESTTFFIQAARALIHKKARVVHAESDLSNYDLICLGTPVWAFAPAPAMNTYLDICSGLLGRPVVIFTTYGSGIGVRRCFNYMQKILSTKGASDFRHLSIQQLKVNDKEFVNQAISGTLQL